MSARKSFSQAKYSQVVDFFPNTRPYRRSLGEVQGPGGVLAPQLEQRIPGTEESDGGRVEGQVFCRKELLVILRELKHRLGRRFPPQLRKFSANCSMWHPDLWSKPIILRTAAYHLNKRSHQDSDEVIPVRACLSDASKNFFIGYDGKICSKKIIPAPVVNASRRFDGIGGYDGSARFPYDGSVPQPPPMGPSSERASTQKWTKAFEFGFHSTQYFQRAHTCQNGRRRPRSSPFDQNSGPSQIPIMEEYKQTLLFTDPDPSWKPEDLPKDA
ncbi:hypothetical protein DFH08DRAFT_804993 [Mycena albidolilacea]|uniref:Uncharacterized protein n=1 Tax=Mycena albidolilacea TaxID=1033008 RepID=A0AAD7ABG5_9AGAR|nr:hypothetical protein DFH08DRAFT_804993 [Mycena albidolilacea]